MRSRWTTLAIMLAAWGCTAFALLNAGPTTASGVAILAGALVVVFSRGARWIPGLILLPALPYCVGPLYAYSVGDTLWPFPNGSVYTDATLFMVSTLYIAVAVPILIGLEPVLQRAIGRSVGQVIDLSTRPLVRLCSATVIIVLAAQAWVIVAENGVVTAGRSRRGVELLLWVAGDLTGQMLGVVCTVLALAAFSKMSRVERLLQGLLVVSMWIPFILGGGRRILIYAAVPIAIILFLSGARATRAVVAVAATAGLAWFFVVPMVFEGGGVFAEKGHGEWSMSGAPFVAQFSGAISLQDVGATGWPLNITRALPDWLGGGEVRVLADALEHATTLYPSGTSGSIWSDIWTADVGASALGLVSVVLVLLVVPLLLNRLVPGSLILATGTFALLGRTHAPYAVSTILVPAFVLTIMWLLTKVAPSAGPATRTFFGPNRMVLATPSGSVGRKEHGPPTVVTASAETP